MNIRTFEGRFSGSKALLRTYTVSHLHFLEVEVEDMSGRRDFFRKSIWWVPQEWDFSKDDFQNTELRNRLDNLYLPGFENNYEKLVFNFQGSGDFKNVRVNGEEISGDIHLSVYSFHESNRYYQPILRYHTEGKYVYVRADGIYGVKIFGNDRY